MLQVKHSKPSKPCETVAAPSLFWQKSSTSYAQPPAMATAIAHNLSQYDVCTILLFAILEVCEVTKW